MKSKNTFGGKVAKARSLASPPLSQRELAKRLKDAGIDISPAGVAEIEAGKRSLNYCQVMMLASVLNTTASQLLS